MKIDVDGVLDQAKIPAYARRKRVTTNNVTARAEQIIAQAIDYFNEFGAARMSVNRLAGSLGLSPGNLHYHFRTNGDLYRALFNEMNRDVRAILLRPHMPMTLDDIVQHLIDIQDCFWRHRYFFRDLDYLVHSDAVVFVDFLHLQNWAVDQLVELQEFYRINFKMRPIEMPNSGVEVAQNCWMMWISWIRWESIVNDKIKLNSTQLNKIYHRLVWHHISMHAPFMSQRVCAAIAAKLENKLLKGK